MLSTTADPNLETPKPQTVVLVRSALSGGRFGFRVAGWASGLGPGGVEGWKGLQDSSFAAVRKFRTSSWASKPLQGHMRDPECHLLFKFKVIALVMGSTLRSEKETIIPHRSPYIAIC